MQYVRKTSQNFTEDFLENLLVDRGILEQTPEFYEAYFNPTKTNEHSPELLDHMEEGYQLLKRHLMGNGRLYIPVDPDMDGYTSASLFYLYVTECMAPRLGVTPSIEFHIPTNKAHGLEAVMDELEDDKKYDLIVLPDSSSNDYEYHETLTNMGYDILVLDHHEADHYSEHAVVINNQLSANYPNKALSGVGVVYKYLEYWESKEGWEDMSTNYLDLVAAGETGDMMDMQTLENRYICKYGLSHINNRFLQDLIDKQSYSLGDRPLTQIGVAFYIVPLINALIRVGSDIEKERLFYAFIDHTTLIPSNKRGHKPGDMETYSEQMLRACTNAKSRQDKAKEKAVELLGIQISNNCLDDNKILILNSNDLDVPTTLTGLCAMAVAAKYKKPVILGKLCADGVLRGSIRGREESELKDFKGFLTESGLTEFVEGHANAAGTAITQNNISRLIEYANDKLANVNFNEGFYEADFIVQGNCSYLGKMIEELDEGRDLYGQNNKEPVMVVENVPLDPTKIDVVGSRKDTLRFSFNGVTYIKFRATELIDELRMYGDTHLNLTIAGKANMNYWGGRGTPQILIDEIEVRESGENDF